MVVNEDNMREAAKAIQSADALLITAGAGMGVDSGLPDFRGAEGFWKAYPPFRGRPFHEMSTPHWFHTDPQLAWGFFGHRLNLYRNAIPHSGFEILQRWGTQMRKGYFVFTSNVDGQFQRAGFDPSQIVECHGTIHALQCSVPCNRRCWSSAGLQMNVDPSTIHAQSPLPKCLECDEIARPNILMFGDWNWVADPTEEQLQRYSQWLAQADSENLVTIELGAGLAVPTVRLESESRGGKLIRINPRESEVSAGGISLDSRALDALTQLDVLRQSFDW